ncbi:MAG: hypothetical protein KIT31_06940 [Deltaproteobacteria bacterium]|nr:hypothetical protein [Deltaproteobacteria bacterium]
MRRIVTAVVVCASAGCFRPAAPVGAVCDPAAPSCPDGQVCRSSAAGATCQLPGGGDDLDGPPSPPVDTAPGAFAYVQLANGWSVDLHRDLSDAIAFNAADFVDGPETYDNAPDWVFALEAPFATGLGVVAGRRILEVASGGVTVHDFGQHPPNSPKQADDLRSATQITFRGVPMVIAMSSSANGGDGLFTISPDWQIEISNIENNVRGAAFDRMGAFDARGVAEIYLGTDHGIVRDSDDAVITTGDNQTLRVVGSDLLFVRTSAAGDQLVRLASVSHAEAMFAARKRIRLVEGTPREPYLAWAIVNDKQLARVTPAGELEVVAETSDPAFVWQAAVEPRAAHALAGAVYVLESNRGLDLDRVLVLREAP